MNKEYLAYVIYNLDVSRDFSPLGMSKSFQTALEALQIKRAQEEDNDINLDGYTKPFRVQGEDCFREYGVMAIDRLDD